MLQFYEKKRWRSILWSWWFVVVLAAICALLAYAVFDRYQIEQETVAKRLEVERKVADLEKRKEVMQEKVDYLSSDRGVEAEMRRNFDMAQPGEKVVIIIDDDKNNNEIQPLPVLATTTASHPWYLFWR